MIKTTKDPSKYLASLPDEMRDDMITLDKELSKAMSGETRTLWEGVFWGGSQQAIIAYGDYTYVRPGKKDVEWFVVGLALQKNYISIYISAVENGQYVVEKYKDKLGKVKTGKSNISFTKLADLDLAELLHLVRLAKKLTI